MRRRHFPHDRKSGVPEDLFPVPPAIGSGAGEGDEEDDDGESAKGNDAEENDAEVKDEEDLSLRAFRAEMAASYSSGESFMPQDLQESRCLEMLYESSPEQ